MSKRKSKTRASDTVKLSIRKKVNSALLSQFFTQFYDRLAPIKSLGDRGERAAERHLLRKGFIILERSYEDKLGEIDLIAVAGRTIVFVEVKTRTSDIAGDPAEAVDTAKQEKIVRTSIGYLKWNQLLDCDVRFDVISIIWPSPEAQPEIVHFENAFETTGEFQMF
jgi:putative endonuclease